MTRFYLIRHGEPDWELADRAGLVGRDREFVTLTERGVGEMVETARDERLRGAEIIVSSPYPRCLHSAHVLSRALDVPLLVEPRIHEWLACRDATHAIPHEETGALWGRILAMEGDYPPPEEREWDWESPDEIRERALPVLRRYLDRERVIVVTHAGVIYALTNATDIYHGDIVEMTMDEGQSAGEGESPERRSER